MTININPLDPKSIDDAIDQLQTYVNSLPSKCSQLAMAVAELGADTASAVYANAEFDSTHRNASVTAEQTGEGKAAVVASGSDVGFLEFGFGLIQPRWSGNTAYQPPPHGSLSEKWPNGQPRSWWWYDGHQSWGSPPAEGMLTALRTMGANADDIAKEVFGSD